MTTKNLFYPGCILRNLKVNGRTEGGGYVLTPIKPPDEDANELVFYLQPPYFDEEKPPAIDKPLAGPFVFLDKDSFGNRIALKNFSTALFRAIYPHGSSDVVANIPWKQLWESAFEPPVYKPKANIRRASGHWEVWLPHAVVPVISESHLKYMMYQNFFYPVNLSSPIKKFAVYRPQTRKMTWPLRWDCTFEIEFPNAKKVTQKVKVLLHGCIDPLKWHYNIRKHLAGDKNVGGLPEYREHWNNWSGMNVPPDFVDHFSGCEDYAPGDSEPHRCKPSCPKDLFEKVNKVLLNFNEEYFTKAVTLFRECTTIRNRLYIDDSDYPVFNLKVVCYAKKPYKSDKNTFVVLYLNGACFNCNQPEPVVHLSIVTAYAGTDQKKGDSFPRRPHNKLVGKIIHVKEVN